MGRRGRHVDKRVARVVEVFPKRRFFVIKNGRVVYRPGSDDLDGTRAVALACRHTAPRAIVQIVEVLEEVTPGRHPSVSGVALRAAGLGDPIRTERVVYWNKTPCVDCGKPERSTAHDPAYASHSYRPRPPGDPLVDDPLVAASRRAHDSVREHLRAPRGLVTEQAIRRSKERRPWRKT